MKHLVIIPCWNRPGFLQVCLDYISKADGFKDNGYLFAIDRGNSDIYSAIVRPWEKKHRIKAVTHLSPQHTYTGNVYNFMHAFATANEGEWDIVHVIEDDIFISKDYFAWHEMAWKHANESTFSVSACRNQNDLSSSVSVSFQKEALIYRHRSYQSLGVSLSRESMAKIVQHAKAEYWKHPVRYIMEHFPPSNIPATIAEQAGLLHRILIKENQHTIYPLVEPRAYHAGFAGRNRPAIKSASSYTAQAIARMTENDMNRHAKKHKDISHCDLNGHDCQELIMIEQ